MLKITCDCGAIALLPGETTSPVKSPFEETKFNPMPPPSNVSECHCRNCTKLEEQVKAAYKKITLWDGMINTQADEIEKLRREADQIKHLTDKGKALVEENRSLAGKLEAAEQHARILTNQLEDADQAFYRARRERNEANRERDLALAESKRRDEKWQTGLEELLGQKLNFEDPSANNSASAVIGLMHRKLKGAETWKAVAEAWRADYQKLKDQILGMAGRL